MCPARSLRRDPRRAASGPAWRCASPPPCATRLRSFVRFGPDSPRFLHARLISLKTGSELAYLDRRPLGRGAFPRDFDRLLARGAGEEKETADHFPRFRERSIAHDRLLALRSHPHAGRIGLQRLAHGEKTTLLEVLTETQHTIVKPAPLALRPRRAVTDFLQHEQHVCHRLTPWGFP